MNYNVSIREGIEELGIFEKNSDAWVSTRDVAKLFGKEHKDVLAVVREQVIPNVSAEFGQRNFPPSSYRNEQNKRQPEYLHCSYNALRRYVHRRAIPFVRIGGGNRGAERFQRSVIDQWMREKTMGGRK